MASNSELAASLSREAGSTRRKLPEATDAAKQRVRSTVPLTLHYPPEVRSQVKIMSAEQARTIEDLVAEGLNDLFAKYGKPEIAPRKSR